MNLNTYGNTPIKVSQMGFGAGHIGSMDMSPQKLTTLFNFLLDSGINLLDTARAYGASEHRLGQLLKSRREQFVVSTKVGYGVEGVPDWTFKAVSEGIEEALRLMNLEYIDIVHLHSCPLEILKRGEVIEALNEAREMGKIRAAAYSGENEALLWAVQSGHFQGIQTSVNLCDQFSLNTIIPEAIKNNMGVIAKRPLANAFWRFSSHPHGEYCETYWLRWQAMNLASEMPMDELAIRFSAFAPGVSSAIVGSHNPDHLKRNLALLKKGPLDAGDRQKLTDRFVEMGQKWHGEI